MKTTWRTLSLLVVAVAMLLPRLFGESALMGWEAVSPGEHRHVEKVRMTGPTQRNRMPERRGVFKGSFSPRQSELNRPVLIAVSKLSLDGKGGVQSQKVGFTPLSSPPKEGGVIVSEFETEELTFEVGQAFLLVFKVGDETEMVALSISRLFVPS